MDRESKVYSWAWLSAEQVLSHGPCELVYAHLVVSSGSTDTHLYHGDNANGDKIVTLESAAVTGLAFSPPVPIYCRRGLFANIGSNVTGLFIMWRDLTGTEA